MKQKKYVYIVFFMILVGMLILNSSHANSEDETATFNKAYITSYNNGFIDVVDLEAQTVEKSKISVGENPNSAGYNPNGTQIFVTNRSDNTVSVINPKTDKVIDTITVGSGPHGVGFNQNGSKAYVSNSYDEGSISVIDTRTLNVSKTITDVQAPIAIVTIGEKIYVSERIGRVSIIDSTTDKVVDRIAVDGNLYGMSASPKGDMLYVSDIEYQKVHAVNIVEQTVVSIPVISNASATEVSPDGTRLYVAHPINNVVSVIDTADYHVVSTIEVGSDPYVIGVSSDGDHAYTVNFKSDDMSVIDTATNRVVDTIEVGDGPFMVGTFMVPVAVATQDYTVYFESNGGRSISPLTVSNGSKVEVPTDPVRPGYRFQGWYEDEALTQPFRFESSLMPANDLTLYAKWQVDEYTVTFKGANGTTLKSQTVSHGGTATAPIPPTKEGYLFTGWDQSLDNVSANLIVTAQYTKLMDASTPEIMKQPQDITLRLHDEHATLTVQADSPDRGELTYQWYQTIDKHQPGEPIDGANESSLEIPTDQAGTMYYYVQITNTNNKVTGDTIAVISSDLAAVKVQQLSSNADLSNLILTAGKLSPSFESTQQAYSITLRNEIDEIRITPTVASKQATVRVQGQEVMSGATSKAISLSEGENVMTLTVTAEDGTTKTYTIKITRLVLKREAASIVSDNKQMVMDQDIFILDQHGRLILSTPLTKETIEQVFISRNQVQYLVKQRATIQVQRSKVSVNIPAANFMDGQSLTFTVQRLAEDSLPLASKSVSGVYDFTLQHEKLEWRDFEKAIELVFSIDEDQSVNPEELKVYYWNETSQSWEAIGGTYRNGNIHANTRHFSRFAVFDPNDLIEPVETESSQEQNHMLPNTTASMFNWVLLGGLLLAIGIFLLLVRHRLLLKYEKVEN